MFQTIEELVEENDRRRALELDGIEGCSCDDDDEADSEEHTLK
jgi:hypothetical protein